MSFSNKSMIKHSKKITDFLDQYKQSLDAAQKTKFEELQYDTWSFSDEKEFSEKLINLVLSGKKVATARLFIENERAPAVGSLGVILDHEANPRCLIEYTKVNTKPFTDVDFEFAKDEGEGFTDLEDWRKEHRKVFKKWYGDIFSDNSIVVCKRFKLLFPKKRDWQEYYEITKNKPPSKLLIKALEYVVKKDKAIDIGGGALKDTRYLLEQGFDVTVVDKADLMAKEAEIIKSDKLHFFVSAFADFDFPKNEYDIASAMYSLPFNPPESFEEVFAKIKDSLVRGGIFCGQCFGVNDEWSTNQKMTFHTKEQVEKLLSDTEVILLKEEEKDDKTANGTPKHWHVFHFIAKKL